MEHHAEVVRRYATPTPINQITGEWRCTCGGSGTSEDPDEAVALHMQRHHP